MSASIATPCEAALPAERFFRTSLSLLVLTSTVTLVSTGELDIITSFAAPLIVLYKGFRWWHGRPAELSHRAATFCVIAYLAFFPLDALFLSRLSVASSANPPLFAALLASVHFLLFVSIIRFYSVVTDRDAFFLAMLSFAGILAAAVLTVDTTFLILFFIFVLFGVSTFVGMELRRGAVGAVSPALHTHTARDRKLNRALSLSALSVTTGSILLGGVLFFFSHASLPGIWAGPVSALRSCPVSRKMSNLGRSARSKRTPLSSCACRREARLDMSACAGEASRLRPSTAGGGAPRNAIRKNC